MAVTGWFVALVALGVVPIVATGSAWALVGWLVLVLAAQTFLPHGQGVWWQLGLLPVVLVVLCAALALTETHAVKMRVLLVPRLLSAGAVVALLGVVAWLVETA